ncbi:gamma-glutamylcyclotransferase [Xanthobacter aminoxidans]|uniref:gamma-glutamylcyclotransferase n=1 Tax=Xanthobacter aminoxidans TaxID=186280 RepID=UPI0020231808|nr:gamma-glutamylcyclotransferase [Xanthobacter aminoxidans]MCL8384059.1 gamma-glutamylcyclotransferase [Xanthobacter aminoxidans]
MKMHSLTRELIEAGGIDALVARDAPDLAVLTEAERAASLNVTLAARPEGPAWLFAYGSLIWNPTVRVEECRVGRIDGWHRAFCLETVVGRGSPAYPGLTLALDAGGDCTGVALRLPEEGLEHELSLLWRREMLAGAYVPRWLEVSDPAGGHIGCAIAFTMDRTNPHYAGGLSEAEVVDRLANAQGAIGSAADYLFATCEGLAGHGVRDPALDALADAVRKRRQAQNSQG